MEEVKDLIKAILKLYDMNDINTEQYSLTNNDLDEILDSIGAGEPTENNVSTITTTDSESDTTYTTSEVIQQVDFEEDEDNEGREESEEEYDDEEYDEEDEDYEDDEDDEEVEESQPIVDTNLNKINNLLNNNSDEAHSRFSGAEWYKVIKEQVIMVAGIGGIGSWATMLISRLNPKAIWLYDDDRVEVVNMSGQLFSMSDIGEYKTSAIINTIKNYSMYNDLFEKRERVSSDTSAANIMICGFDNMTARKVYYTLWKNHVSSLPEEERSKCLFVDGRLSLNVAQVFALRGDDEYNCELYSKNYLFDDWKADQTVCSMKQTSFMAAFIGSIITNMLVNFCTDSYELPFKTEYDSNMVMLKTED